MCRSTDFDRLVSSSRRNRLNINAFEVRFSRFSPSRTPLPHSLTLVYLPTMIDENGLEIAGSKIRPGSSAFVSLPRRDTSTESSREVSYGSRERVVASDGARFEVYLRDERVLKGTLRRRIGDGSDRYWALELGCLMEREIDGLDSSEVEVRVSEEGHVAAISEKVELKTRRPFRRRFEGLEEIPEGYECFCDCGSDGGDSAVQMDGDDLIDDGVGWAVDVGIWVVCLGFGLLVSKASAKTLRRRKIL